MPTYTKASQVIARCTHLKDIWAKRDRKMAQSYDTLSLVDELEQQNMESVVSNDPRTFYNTALHLLAPNIPHRIPVQGLDREAIAWASTIERSVQSTWSGLDREYRKRGRKSWMEYMTGLLLATGWYSVLCMATEDKLVAEVWNPIEVYPDWDGEGLVSVSHVFGMGPRQTSRLFKRHNWEMGANLKGKSVTVYDLWEVTDDGVINTTVIDNQLVKPEVIEPFEEIPIFVGPAGGLPDDGPINAKRRATGQRAGGTRVDWRESIGQSIFATNEGIYRNFNRSVTFLQQILRDTAQPKYWEKSRGASTILSTEDLEKRGAIFRLGEGDDVGTIQMPGIPVELTSLIGQYEQMIQRGALPNALSGQVQNIPLGLMSQVAAAAVQVLGLYHRTITGLLTDIDNTWVRGVTSGTFESESLIVPQELAIDDILFDIKYPISIPGDLIQRATVTRMISPGARISATTALDLFFSEIQDPQQELAQARSDDAQSSPVFAMLTLISSLREEADLLRKSGNNEDADLLTQASLTLIAQMGQQQGGPTNGQRPPSEIPADGLDPSTQNQLNQLNISPEGN